MFINHASEDYEYDVFISHASEDNETFVRPLAHRLENEGCRVWFDEFTLRIGDSLRRSIDRGLTNSRYGIVVISPNFLNKEWPQRELDGLTARERDGIRVILPIWHGIERSDVLRSSPTLADKLALQTSQGMRKIVREIMGVVRGVSLPRDELSSECNVNYNRLRNLLREGKWKDADYETYLVMLQAVGRQEGDSIRHREFSNFPCTDLRTIDNLWVHYSSGRFGFSIQNNVYSQLLGTRLNNRFNARIWNEFCNAIRWIDENELTKSKKWIKSSKVIYNTLSPPGHLPRFSLMHFNGRDVGFLMEIVECSYIIYGLAFAIVPLFVLFIGGFNLLLPLWGLMIVVGLMSYIFCTIGSICLELGIMNKLGRHMISLLSRLDYCDLQ